MASMEGNTEWQKFNYDTGAGITALPPKFAVEATGQTEHYYKTASGELIPDYGTTKLRGIDENGIARTLRGRVTEVHKP